MIPFTYLLVTLIMISAGIFTSAHIPIIRASDVSSEVLFRSPSFRMQEILDPTTDWIDLETTNYTEGGDRSTDIVSVDYFSDGKTLNATLWLYSPFKMQPPLSDENVNYGMYIDADFDENTGFGGIDYKVELGWNNQSKEWTKVLEKWSHFGEVQVLDNRTLSPDSFSKPGEHYVRLWADLDAMLSPNKYKVVFYGEVRREGSYRSDFTRSVTIPPVELTVSTLPKSVEFRKGDQAKIEVSVNTTQGYEPTVNLLARSPSKNLVLDFTQDDTVNVPFYTLRIPSYGVATVPLTITSTENSTIGPYTFFIFANSSFAPEAFYLSEDEPTFLPYSASLTENIFAQTSANLVLRPPLTFMETIFGSSENSIMLNIPQEYLIGLYGLVLTFLVPLIVRWFIRMRQSKHLGERMIAINAIYDRSSEDKGEAIKALEEARRDVSTTYAKGKISESDYKILNEKISEYEKKMNQG